MLDDSNCHTSAVEIVPEQLTVEPQLPTLKLLHNKIPFSYQVKNPCFKVNTDQYKSIMSINSEPTLVIRNRK